MKRTPVLMNQVNKMSVTIKLPIHTYTYKPELQLKCYNYQCKTEKFHVHFSILFLLLVFQQFTIISWPSDTKTYTGQPFLIVIPIGQLYKRLWEKSTSVQCNYIGINDNFSLRTKTGPHISFFFSRYYFCLYVAH